MAMVTTLFFMWGFLTVLNDILIPHLKAIFELNYAQVMLVQFSFFTSYFVFAYPAGRLLERAGFKKTMVAGLLTMAAGALLFIPAATVVWFPLFLAALVVLAGGMTLLQVSANPYVAVLGPPETASSRLNLAQAFNSLGTAVGPRIGGPLILAAVPLTAASVKAPYLAFAAVLCVLASVIASFPLPEPAPGHATTSGGKGSVWAHRPLVYGAGAIFLYVGAEVAIGSFLINYLGQPDIGGLSPRDAAAFVSYYWAGAMVGRFAGSALLRRFRTGKLLGVFAAAAAALVCVSMASAGKAAMGAILAVGLFNSIMFPSIFTLAIDGLGPLTGEGSGVLVAAIVGGAIVPELQGLLADRVGIQHAFILPVLCYLYIAWFGLSGSKTTSNGS